MSMSRRTSIYIPSPLYRRADVLALIEQNTRACGGVTITEQRGGWVSDVDGLVYEHVSVYSWWHKEGEPPLLHVATLARVLLTEGKQEAVLIEYLRPHGHTAVIAKLNDKGEVTW